MRTCQGRPGSVPASLARLGHRIGLVFMTADEELAASDEMRRTGAPCLGKPVDEAALLDAIDGVLKPANP
jgi:FixJ family two-component response regulator